jgi:hypothetical protein
MLPPPRGWRPAQLQSWVVACATIFDSPHHAESDRDRFQPGFKRTTNPPARGVHTCALNHRNQHFASAVAVRQIEHQLLAKYRREEKKDENRWESSRPPF